MVRRSFNFWSDTAAGYGRYAPSQSTPMPDRLLFYAIAVLAGAFSAVGDGLMNRWAKDSGQWGSLITAYLLFTGAFVLFLVLLRTGNHLAHSAAVFTAVNDLLVLWIAWRIFREQLTPTAWIGIGIIVIGLIVAEVGS